MRPIMAASDPSPCHSLRVASRQLDFADFALAVNAFVYWFRWTPLGFPIALRAFPTRCQDRFSRSETDAGGGAKAIGERVGSGSYYSRVDRVEAKRVRVDEQRVDGDRVSDNRSAEKTWPWMRSCVPCTSRAVGIQRRAERRETGVSYLIYELKSYNEISTVYI